MTRELQGIVNPDDLSQSPHRQPLAAIQAVEASAEEMDLVTVGADLQGRRGLPTAGALSTWSRCRSRRPPVNHVASNAEAVHEAAVRRRLMEAYRPITETLRVAGQALRERRDSL